MVEKSVGNKALFNGVDGDVSTYVTTEATLLTSLSAKTVFRICT